MQLRWWSVGWGPGGGGGHRDTVEVNAGKRLG